MNSTNGHAGVAPLLLLALLSSLLFVAAFLFAGDRVARFGGAGRAAPSSKSSMPMPRRWRRRGRQRSPVAERTPPSTSTRELSPPKSSHRPEEPNRERRRSPESLPERQRGRRRRLGTMPKIDEATMAKQMRSYLGGLYPPVDKDMLPLYLRDTAEDAGDGALAGHPGGSGGGRDLIFFWHIPKASGSSMKNVMNFCFDISRAEKLREPASMDFVRDNILNMDTCSPDGLSFSFANQIVNSDKVDAIVSNYFLSGAALFTDVHHGKTFSILRHPIDLALSLFHYRRKASWERSFRKDWMKLSFADYAASDQYMDNWMVRQLTGTMPWVDLNEDHLDRAKRMMERKIFVGIMSEMDETIRQLKWHYGWVEREAYCAYNLLHEKHTNENKHSEIQGGRGGKTWNLVAEKEKWDLALYHFALELFARQRERYPPK